MLIAFLCLLSNKKKKKKEENRNKCFPPPLYFVTDSQLQIKSDIPIGLKHH